MYSNPMVAIEIIESADPSVQCISALRQVMDLFQGGSDVGRERQLSVQGKDFKAVYAWFIERYKPNNGL